jgi:hypothetical protein
MKDLGLSGVMSDGQRTVESESTTVDSGVR